MVVGLIWFRRAVSGTAHCYGQRPSFKNRQPWSGKCSSRGVIYRHGTEGWIVPICKQDLRNDKGKWN